MRWKYLLTSIGLFTANVIGLHISNNPVSTFLHTVGLVFSVFMVILWISIHVVNYFEE
jgi:hypothetical protein